MVPPTEGRQPRQPPLVEHLSPVARLGLELAEVSAGGGREHDVGPEEGEREGAEQLAPDGGEEAAGDLGDRVVAGGRRGRGRGHLRGAQGPLGHRKGDRPWGERRPQLDAITAADGRARKRAADEAGGRR